MISIAIATLTLSPVWFGGWQGSLEWVGKARKFFFQRGKVSAKC